MVTKTKHKVALIHNYYLERGGEDVSFEAEKSLLLKMKHEVCIYTRNNSEINSYSPARRMSLALRTIWASDSYADMRHLLAGEKPDICHFNNTFPLISPSAYDACRDAGVPVIQNLRNYRLVCPNGYLFRDHGICEDCLGRRLPWPGVLHACYRGSRIQSAVVAAMLYYHDVRRTWADKVDIYVALTHFSRNKFIAGGLPAEKIVVKPNFTVDHGLGVGHGDHALFIGRLSNGKGIFELLRAWSECRKIPLKIVGDGPLRKDMLAMINQEGLANVELCGQLSSEQVVAMIKNSRFLVYPSIWYENFPRVLLESFSCGRPVIAANAGVAPEIVKDGKTGNLFRSGDSRDLAVHVQWLWDRPDESKRMGTESRREYEQKYTPEQNYQMLLEIYSKAMAESTMK